MIGTIVTTKGRTLMAKMVAMEGGISFTRAAVGTGDLPKGYDPSHLIGLNQYKMDGKITGASSSQETASITFQIASKDVEEGFIITEAGLYADDPDEGEILYAYLDMHGDPQYIYPRGGDVNKVAEITLGVIIGQVDRITAMISPGGLVTREQMEGMLETKLDRGEDSGDSIIRFTSGDSAGEAGWTDVDALQSGETHKSFAQKVSTMFKNLRYIWGVCGSTDISKIGDGTLTGAINALNTGIASNSWYRSSSPVTNTSGDAIKTADGTVFTADSTSGCYKITLVTAHSDIQDITSEYIVTAYEGVWYIIDAIMVGAHHRAPRLKVVANNKQLAVYSAEAISSSDLHIFYRVDTIYRP